MQIKEEQKINILMQALEERYKSIHIIRERVQIVSIWILGILLGVSGWLFQANIYFSLKQKIFSIIFLLIIWLILRRFYFDDLKKGFNTQRKVASDIEDVFQLFDINIYKNSENSIYPLKWRKSGQKGSEGKFFENAFNLLIIGFGILSVVILLLK